MSFLFTLNKKRWFLENLQNQFNNSQTKIPFGKRKTEKCCLVGDGK